MDGRELFEYHDELLVLGLRVFTFQGSTFFAYLVSLDTSQAVSSLYCTYDTVNTHYAVLTRHCVKKFKLTE